MKKSLIIMGLLGVLATPAKSELVQQFKNPTFSGNGWASHVLTVEQMRQGAKSQQESKSAAEKAKIDAEANNTPLAKFMALFTGQVYSQLATQLTNNLFKDCVAGAGSSCSDGRFLISEIQKIEWKKLGGNVTLEVYDGKKNGDGSISWNAAATQTITVPISSFSF